jgi:restriction endonuclease S subunit
MREGWVETTAGDIAFVNPETAKPTENSQRFRYVDLASVSASMGIDIANLEEYTFDSAPGRARRIIREGDVLISTVRPYLRGFAIVPPELDSNIASTGFTVLRADDSRTISDFVWAITRTKEFVDFLMDRATGSNYPAVRPKDISDFPIALPPLAEQRRIVDVIESVDNYITALETRAETARTARSALLHHLLSNPGPDWVHTTLGDTCTIYQPETISKEMMSDDAEFVVYGANGPVGRYEKFNHSESEVVVTCRGATCGVVNMTPPCCWITGNAMVFQPKNDRLSKRFLYWALQSSIDVSIAISGSAQPQITRSGVSPTKFRLPPPGFQNTVVSIVDNITLAIDAFEIALANARNLRTALLSDLLSGNHEIPDYYEKHLGAA